MAHDEDRELLRGFLGGHRDSIDRLTGWISDVVHHSVWGDESSREDIVSDTLIKLLRLFGAEEFRYESSLKTYVCRVARYTAVDFLRQRRRTKLLLTPENLRFNPVPTPEEVYVEAETVRQFDRLLGLIDPRCRRLWEVLFSEHLSYAELATREGVTSQAIKVRVFRCKEEALALRDRMRNRIPDRPPGDSRARGTAP